MTNPDYVQLSLTDLGLQVQQADHDSVNHPRHYTHGSIETIDYTESCLDRRRVLRRLQDECVEVCVKGKA
jgi:hypothetical protein